MRLEKYFILLVLLFFTLACQAVVGVPTQTSVPPTQKIEEIEVIPAPTLAPTEEVLTDLGYEATNVSPAPEQFALVKITGNGASLADILQAEAQKATALGLKPFADFYADWCPPCRAIEAVMDDERMIDAFTGTYIIQLDFDEWERHLSGSGFYVPGIPAYYEIDAQGNPTGRMITGASWGEDIAANIAPPMKAFFAGE